jgi:hypothetical protein
MVKVKMGFTCKCVSCLEARRGAKHGAKRTPEGSGGEAATPKE